MEHLSAATSTLRHQGLHLERMRQRQAELQGQLAAVLPPEAGFVWELGCGHGHFLTAFAHAHPGQPCVGIDIAGDRIERALRKRDRARLTNLHFVRADAAAFMAALPTGARFSQLFILFPDPWPKLRHWKHRVLQPTFLCAAAQCALPDAQLCFRTDFKPYFDQAHAFTRAHPEWLMKEEAWPFEFETVFQHRASDYQSFIARRS